MNFLKIAWRDISSIFRNRFIRVSVTAIIIVPLLYSLLYLAAFWDPYSRLQDVKVAVVNLDAGTTMDGKESNYGRQVVDNLKNNHELGWTIVPSLKQAEKGLKGKDYYAEFIIPKDFSEKVTSAKSGKPEQPKIVYRSNDKKNFIASQINGKVEVLLKDQINQKITKEYTKIAFDNLYTLKDGLNKAADGSKQISDGLNTANGGVGQAKNTVADIIKKFSGNEDLNYLLQSSTAPAARQLINDGLAAKDMNTSMLSLVNNSNISTISSTVNAANSVVNSNGVKTIMQTPSVENLVSEITSGNSTALQGRLQAGSKLMGDAGMLVTAANGVDAAKLNSMLAPFGKALSSDQAMQAALTNSNKLINDASTLNTTLGKVDNTKLESMLAPFTPIMSDDAKMQAALTNAQKLMADANALNTVLGKVDNTKLASMLAPFTPIMSDDTKMQAALTNAQKLMADANTLNTALSSVDKTKLAAMMQPFAPIMSSDAAMQQTITNAQKLIADADTLNTALSSVDQTKLAAMMQPFAPILSNDALMQQTVTNAQKLMADATAVNDAFKNVDTDKLASMNGDLTTVLNNSGSITGLLAESQNMSNKVTVDPSDAQQINNLSDAQLAQLSQSKQALITAVEGSNLDASQKAAIETELKIGSTVTPAIKDLITLKGTLDDPGTKTVLQAVNNTLSTDNVNNVKNALPILSNAGVLKQDLSDNMPVLGGVQSSLTIDNINNVKPLLGLSGQVGTMSQDLSNNMPVLNGVQNALTADNISNVKPLLGLSGQMGTMSQDLSNGMPLLGGVQSSFTADNINNVKPLMGLTSQMGSMEQDLSNGMPLLGGVQSSLTADNINNVKPLMGLTSQMGSMKQDLSDNMPLLSGVQSSLTVDNINNIKPLIELAPKFTQIKSDLASNSENIALINDIVAKSSDPDVQAIGPKVKQLQTEIEQAKPLMTQLNTPQMMTALSQSPAMVNQLVSMQDDLQNNSKILEVTKNELSDDNIATAQKLISSVPSITDKINQLSSGMTKLSDGAKELNTKLADGADTINKSLVNSSDTMGDFVSDPVKMTSNPMYSVKTYGEGFAPYFIPLSLWVGAIMMFFVITDKVDDDIKAGPRSIVLGKFLSYGYIGIAQAVLASIAVLCLGLRPKNIILYFAFNIFMSFVFIAIIQSLVFLLGQAGRLLSIVLLILQLTSSAGTFPIEVVPKFFKVLNPFMPFTYCTSALRELVAGPDYTVFSKDVGILAATAVVFLIISVLMKGHADKIQEVIEEKKAQAASN